MNAEEIERLLERYNAGTATPDEIDLVDSWYLKHKPAVNNVSHQQIEEDEAQSLDHLLGDINGPSKKLRLSYLAIAASILVFFTTGIYLLVFHKAMPQQAVALNNLPKQDIAPGGNKAVITLADGSQVVLTGAKNGKLAKQGNILINKTTDGQVSYAAASSDANSSELVYNTATTPRGGQYQFILSDGTKVWLNSASSIKYPVAFNTNERKVELTGEAYFEVAHNAKKPFRVVSNGQTVEVLGTHFNINAYSDENVIKTTLLQGSVKVSSTGGTHIIKPGEQAQLAANGNLSVVDADVERAVAWKNGFFYFDDNNILEVMRQLSRWYDVDVKYEGSLPPRQFSGEISKNVTASQMLDILSFKKIHYKIDKRSIIITP